MPYACDGEIKMDAEQDLSKVLDQSLMQVEIMNHGFVVFQSGEKEWKIKKVSTPIDNREMPDIQTRFPSWLECCQYVLKLIKEREHTFEISVRYNRGLGPEHKVLGLIDAKTLKEAQEAGQSWAEEEMNQDIIIEVRARPL